MDKKPSTPSAKRQGFSLVLALVMAAALVIVIIVLAAFLKVESRLAINSVLLTRARLNTVASLRGCSSAPALTTNESDKIAAENFFIKNQINAVHLRASSQ